MMIDIETLGTRPGSVILSIAAVQFEAGVVDDVGTFYEEISSESCTRAGLKVDISTVEWWFRQGGYKASGKPERLVDVLAALNEYIRHSGAAAMWAKSPSFDMVMINEASYNAYEFGLPQWKYWQWRDMRTIMSCISKIDETKLKAEANFAYPDDKHNALQDALRQAYMVSKAMQLLPRWSGV